MVTNMGLYSYETSIRFIPLIWFCHSLCLSNVDRICLRLALSVSPVELEKILLFWPNVIKLPFPVWTFIYLDWPFLVDLCPWPFHVAPLSLSFAFCQLEFFFPNQFILQSTLLVGPVLYYVCGHCGHCGHSRCLWCFWRGAFVSWFL